MIRISVMAMGGLLLAMGCSGASESGSDRGPGGSGGDGDGAAGDGDGALGSTGFDNGLGNTGSGGSFSTGGLEPDLGCEQIVVNATRGTPEFLIVLDKSGSMGGENHPACPPPPDCNANPFDPRCFIGGFIMGVDRWTPSVAALGSITGQLDAEMRFGLMMYPSDNECGAGDVQVPIGFGTSAMIGGVLDTTCPGGRTPTSAALSASQGVFDMRTSGPDESPGVPFVLLVTDGSPNCVDGGDAVTESVAAVQGLAAGGIRTYVIGYDTQGTDLGLVLDQLAAAGNTGDVAHRPVEDELSLLNEFQSIAASAVSCSYVLMEPVADGSYVRVTLDGHQVNLDDADGWLLGDDMMSVSLQGGACNSLQDGGDHLLEVTVECEVVLPE